MARAGSSAGALNGASAPNSSEKAAPEAPVDEGVINTRRSTRTSEEPESCSGCRVLCAGAGEPGCVNAQPVLSGPPRTPPRSPHSLQLLFPVVSAVPRKRRRPGENGSERGEGRRGSKRYGKECSGLGRRAALTAPRPPGSASGSGEGRAAAQGSVHIHPLALEGCGFLKGRPRGRFPAAPHRGSRARPGGCGAGRGRPAAQGQLRGTRK